VSVARNSIEARGGGTQQVSLESKNLSAVEKPALRAKSDRRRASRFSVLAGVCVVDVQSGAERQARITDLSMSGCYVDTMSPFPAGAQIRIKITHQGKSFDALARVAYSQQSMGMGVAFVKAEPDQLKTLREWLSEFKAHTS
jgi:hypothetical protein